VAVSLIGQRRTCDRWQMPRFRSFAPNSRSPQPSFFRPYRGV